jgi:DNA-binding MarR family transcriptional regulator
MTTDTERTDDVSLDVTTDLLLITSRLLVAIWARSIARVDETITIPQLRALLVLAAGEPMSVENLSRALGAGRSAAGRVAERLAGAGLVALRPRRKPGRELLVVLTPRGAKVVADFAAFRRRELARVVRRLAPPQRRALAGAFAAFTAVGEAPAPHFDLG